MSNQVSAPPSAPGPERPWTVEGDAKRHAVQRMFEQIAPRYDRLNDLMSLALHRRWRRMATRGLRLSPGDKVLDLCCGTGDFFAPLRGLVGSQGTIVGADFAQPMLEQAATKGGADQLVLADALALPFADDTFDAVTVGWGIRNVVDIDAAHRQICRVLRPGGRFASVDMARPRNRMVRTLSRWTTRRLLPWLGARFGFESAYTYLPESTERFASREELAESMRKAGMHEVRYRDLFFGVICVHWGTKR